MGREIEHDSIEKNRAHNLTRNKEEEKKGVESNLEGERRWDKNGEEK